MHDYLNVMLIGSLLLEIVEVCLLANEVRLAQSQEKLEHEAKDVFWPAYL